MEEGVQKYKEAFGGSEIDKTLEELIDMKMASGMNETDILRELADGMALDKNNDGAIKFNPADFTIDPKLNKHFA